MALGGKRPGAGRKPGSTNRPVLRNYFTEAEITALVEKAKLQAETDPTIMKFLLEQVFGKAVQPIGNDEGRPLVVSFDPAFKS